MNTKLFISSIFLSTSLSLFAQKSATITLHTDQSGQIIPKEIYGQFAEHLGTCIYGGLWVGENSDIPNINGYRTDVFNALKELRVPVLRWPGGCFADEYHWMDGIGPKENRPKMVNNNWGGTIEDNSFGTHEFLNLCEMLGCEPISAERRQWYRRRTCQMGGIHDLRRRLPHWHACAARTVATKPGK